MSVSNWPGGIDMSHQNHTGIAPRVSKYEGMGGWAPASRRIPRKAWVGAAIVVALLFSLAYVGAAAGF